jgi:peptidyl-prolyl cis-trans isomerase SurA
LLALILSTAGSAAPSISNLGVKHLDGVAAVVNDDVIVESELENRIRTIRARLRKAGTPAPATAVLERQVLERLILDRLQLQLADRLGVRVDDGSLNEALREMAQRNGLSLSQFRDVLEQEGYDFAAFREEIRQQMVIAQVQQRQVEARIRVSDREIDNHLATQAKQGNEENAYHLAHILVALPEAASAEEIAATRQRTHEILDSIQRGTSFASAAVAHSSGQQALQGGDLGWRREPELPTIFAGVVPQMAIGDIRGPIQSPSGFHLIQLLDKRGEARHIVQQTRARHILIRTEEGTNDAEAEHRLAQLRERIEAGEAFVELARAHSEDTASAAKGGELGWINPGDMVPAFRESMEGLQPGQISQPFRTQFGWHLVQVVQRRAHDDTDELRRLNAKEQIRERKAEEELQSWLRQLRDEAYVELRIEE